jgi:hypothetical protein
LRQRKWSIRKGGCARRVAILCLLAFGAGPPAVAAPPTPGNLLVVSNSGPGLFQPPRVGEYGTDGVLVQDLGLVPAPGGTPPSSEQARDLISGGKGFFLYNGTFAPFLAAFDFATGSYNQTSFGGWNTINNTTYGGIARDGDFVYVTDTRLVNDPTSGIVRFDTNAGGAVRFAEGYEPIDLAFGLDGFLYALLTDEQDVLTIDPTTLEVIATIEFSERIRGIAVDSDGWIYGAGRSASSIYRAGPDGMVDRALPVPAFVHDIDLAPDGRLALGSSDGRVVLSDRRLESFQTFSVGSSRNLFVAFVPEPENEPPDCSSASAEPTEIWPPDRTFQAVSMVGVSDPDADPVVVTVTGIGQDEPLEGSGTGKTCPDGDGTGTDTALVRAERSGAPSADGRVYHLRFEAVDGRGGHCSGVVTVCVPHDRGASHGCGDQGESFDSTVCGG